MFIHHGFLMVLSMYMISLFVYTHGGYIRLSADSFRKFNDSRFLSLGVLLVPPCCYDLFFVGQSVNATLQLCMNYCISAVIVLLGLASGPVGNASKGKLAKPIGFLSEANNFWFYRLFGALQHMIINRI